VAAHAAVADQWGRRLAGLLGSRSNGKLLNGACLNSASTARSSSAQIVGSSSNKLFNAAFIVNTLPTLASAVPFDHFVAGQVSMPPSCMPCSMASLWLTASC
jgi:hypothetical protein